MTKDQINRLLSRVDPMNTGCNENEDMETEYASQARDIAASLAAGMEPRAAVLAAFDEAFWEGCLLEEDRLPAMNEILAGLQPSAL